MSRFSRHRTLWIPYIHPTHPLHPSLPPSPASDRHLPTSHNESNSVTYPHLRKQRTPIHAYSPEAQTLVSTPSFSSSRRATGGDGTLRSCLGIYASVLNAEWRRRNCFLGFVSGVLGIGGLRGGRRCYCVEAFCERGARGSG